MFLRFFMILVFLISGCSSKQKNMKKMSQEYQRHVESLKSFSISGFNLKYIDQGRGDVFLLVHGIPTNSWMYRKIIKELSKKYRVIAPDLIGFGQSSKPKNGLSLLKQAGVLRGLIQDQLKVKKINLMVHDFGGPIALSMLTGTDIKVDQAVILDTFVFNEGWNNGYSFFSKTMNKVLPSVVPNMFFEMGINKMFTSKMSESVVSGYVEPMKSKHGTKAYSCLYEEIPEVKNNVLPVIQKTLNEKFDKDKTKLIWGKNDPFLDSQKQVKKIVKALNLSRDNILIIKDGKHLVADENSKEILEFIK